MDTIIHLNAPAKGPIRRFFARTGRALLDPARFFREDFPRMDTADALAFGLANAWVASVLSFFWNTMNSLLLVRLFERWVQRLLASDEAFSFLSKDGESFLWAAGALVLAPFLLLTRAFLASVLLFLFARLLVSEEQRGPEPVSYVAALRIQGVALTGQWFSLVPLFGGILALIVGFLLAVTGVRERFGTSTRRAVAVVAAPYLLFFLALLATGTILLVALFQLPLHELLEFEP